MGHLSRWRGAIASCLLAGLWGCAGSQSAAFQAARHVVWPDAAVNAHALDPSLRYLRVTTNGTAALMVLGYTDQDAHGQTVQVWYSSMGEVLRLRNGRLAGVVGTPVEWRAATWSAEVPPWSAAMAAAGPWEYVRTHDEMPSYRLGMNDHLRLQRLQVAPGKTALAGIGPESLTWFEESSIEGAGFPARYGVPAVASGGDAEPVYGEQCLSAAMCLTWQQWPPTGRPSP